MEGLWADDAGEEDTASAVAHVAGLHLGLVDETVLAVPISIGNARQLGLYKQGRQGQVSVLCSTCELSING